MGLGQGRTRLVGLLAPDKKLLRSLREKPEPLGVVPHLLGEGLRDLEPVTRELLGWSDRLSEGEATVDVECLLHPRHGSRHSHGLVPRVGGVDARAGEGVGLDSLRRCLTKVERSRLAVCATVDHEPAPAYAAGLGPGYTQSEGRRDRRIYGIAAVVEHFEANPGSIRGLGGDHASVAAHRLPEL